MGVEQNSPILTPGVANLALSSAMAKSQASNQLTSSRSGNAVDLGYDWLRQMMYFLHHLGAGGEDSPEVMDILVRACELLDVVSGTKGGAVALQDQDLKLLVCCGLVQNVIQGRDDIEAQGISFLGIIQSYPANRRFTIKQYMLHDKVPSSHSTKIC